MDAPRDYQSANDPEHQYSRVLSQAPNRFQTCSFLAGLTFTSFASILASDPLDLTHSWPTTGLHLFIDVFLGAATVALLLATVGLYAAMNDLGSITQAQVAQGDAIALDAVQRCYATYHRSGSLLVTAVVCIILSLLLLGVYVAWPVGVVTLVVVPASMTYLHLYRDHLVYGLPAWFPGAKKSGAAEQAVNARHCYQR
jgi:hypothetical protein